MRNHGYLRNYASTIRMLAERGHQVIVGSCGPERHMAVDTPGFLAALSRDLPAVSTIKFPRRGDEWAPLAAPAHLVARTARVVLVANAESHRQAAQ